MHERLNQIYQTYVIDLRRKADFRAKNEIPSESKILIVLLTVMGGLIFLRYYGNANAVRGWVPILRYIVGHEVAENLYALLFGADRVLIFSKVYWAMVRIFVYILVPLIVCVVFLSDGTLSSLYAQLGLKKCEWQDLPFYGACLMVVAPFVVIASYEPSFQNKYPFYKLSADESMWPWFICWEILYSLQFVGLEIFYRGFMLHGLKGRFGYGSIYVMMLPYMMIHFGKPMPECIGSVVAGFALGTLSLKSGSIWGGVFLHVAVAWLMDGMSLFHQGRLHW
ncbi:MAG: CPBP family intramembrane metalloprotease [Myxococcales bacterium]|nr:CPBP family intramembrane metalloprotease [Myxococcales bacterium]